MIKVDSFDQQQRLGALHERPAGRVPSRGADDRRDEAGEDRDPCRSHRALNPWAILEPVNVGGVTISRATLHNEEDINASRSARATASSSSEPAM